MINLLQAVLAVLLTAAGMTAGTLEGTLVEDGSGNAIPRGLVRAFAGTNSAPFAEAQTDANGRFALGIPSTGGYVLRISKPGYIWVEVAVPEAVLNPLRVRMPKLATFEGQVRQTDGAAVRGASVAAFWRAWGSSLLTRAVTARSDDSGRFLSRICRRATIRLLAPLTWQFPGVSSLWWPTRMAQGIRRFRWVRATI